MQITWSERNWFDDNKSIKRHFIAFTISVAIVILVLTVPLHIMHNYVEDKKFINLELIKTKPVVKEIETVEPLTKPITQAIPSPQKSIPQTSIETKPVKPIKIESKVIVSEAIKVKPLNPEPLTQKPLLSSPEIFNLTYGKVRLNPIDKDFQKKTGNEGNYVIKKIERPEWYKVKKHINEERDKPSTYMEFYSLGIQGNVERFFDRISYQKNFTTKHGTKIYCGGIGPLVMCSWK